MISVELLSPARNADIGIEAIRHGADAVYIGAAKFGARAAAGNSLSEIQRLVDYAHTFSAKVYVTINTILSDEELAEAEKLIQQLYDIQVDGLIVQDMAITQLYIPPIPLHASTQTDNRTAEKVQQLYEYGFDRVVLARELSLNEIRNIHNRCPNVELEAFVHGALCVSLSGQCYASECLFGRSANRGECAQVCRMEFDLIRKSYQGTKPVEHTIMTGKHLLSLKDLCLINSLKELIDVGVTSLKIEGRLKDMAYVKNVTSAYSEALNLIISSEPDKYRRSSEGHTELKFRPDVHKSFNRGFTSYFLYGRNERIFSFETPKSVGEEVGTIKEIFPNSFTVAGTHNFSNGDGLCFIDRSGKLFGFRLNKVENGRLYPREMPHNIMPKMKLYRNFDKRLYDTLQGKSAERYIFVDMTIDETSDGFRLGMTDEYGKRATINVTCPKELARSPQAANIERQLSRLGGTCYQLRSLTINYKKNWFIPSSHLSDWRRQLVTKLAGTNYKYTPRSMRTSNDAERNDTKHKGDLNYLTNVFNTKAKAFYKNQGYGNIDWAYEKTHPQGVPVMFCKHCIRYSLGWCKKYKNENRNGYTDVDGQLFLQLANGRRMRLDFNCGQCLMKVVDTTSEDKRN